MTQITRSPHGTSTENVVFVLNTRSNMFPLKKYRMNTLQFVQFFLRERENGTTHVKTLAFNVSMSWWVCYPTQSLS